VPHGLQGISIEQRSHLLPQSTLAPELRPPRLEQGAAQLLDLIHEERQHHKHGKHHREMLIPMPIIVLEVLALVFQRIACLILDTPPCSSPPHELIHGPFGHTEVGDPAKVVDLVPIPLPALQAVDAQSRMGRIERYVTGKLKPVAQPRRGVVALIIGDAPRLLSSCHLLEQGGMIAFFDTQNIMQVVLVQHVDMRGVGTQAVLSDYELEVRVVLAQLDNQPLGGMALAIVFLGTVLLDDRLGHQGQHFAPIGVDESRAQPLVTLGDRAVAVMRVQTRRTVNLLGGEIPRTIER